MTPPELLEFRLDRLEKMHADTHADIKQIQDIIGPHVAVEELKFDQIQQKFDSIAKALAELSADIKKSRDEISELKITTMAKFGPGAIVAAIITVVAELIRRFTT
jgi:chaperonin cofactor prefoldin